MSLRERKKQAASTSTPQKKGGSRDAPLRMETSYTSYKAWDAQHLVTSLVLMAVVLWGYLANGDMTIGGDSTANMLLTLKLVKPGALSGGVSQRALLDLFSFSPVENPCMFQWTYRADWNSVPQRGLSLQHWNLTAPVILASGEKAMKSAWELYELKRITLEGPNYYIVEASGHPGRYVNTFSIGTAIVAAPVFFLYTTFVAPIKTDVCQYSREHLLTISKFTAALFSASACAIMYLISVRLLRSYSKVPTRSRAVYDYIISIAMTLIFGFGTSLLSINSQALWQHAPNTMFLTLGLYQYIKLHQDLLSSPSQAEEESSITSSSILCMLSLCLAVYCRPTSALYCISTIIYLFIECIYFKIKSDRRAFVIFKSLFLQGLVGAILGGIFLLHNYLYFKSPFTTGQSIAAEFISRSKSTVPGTWTTPFLEGAQMLLVSPSRGLFTHSPIFLLSILGLVRLVRPSSSDPVTVGSLRPFAIGMLVLVYAASTFFDYWGGWCWSYRPLTDTTPILMALLIISIPSGTSAGHSKLYLLAILCLGLVSIYIQLIGAYLYDPMIWNYQLARKNSSGHYEAITDLDELTGKRHISGSEHLNIDVPQHRHRLWSWSDSQLLYLIKNSRLAHQVKKHTVQAWKAGQLS